MRRRGDFISRFRVFTLRGAAVFSSGWEHGILSNASLILSGDEKQVFLARLTWLPSTTCIY